MKKTPLLFSLLGLSFFLQAQTNFQRTYGGLGDEQGHALTFTQDGGIAIAGHTTSFGAGGDDIFILKVDNQGGIQWQKTYGRALDEYGFGVAIMETPQAELVVTGLTGGNGGSITDVFVFKTDPQGNLLWDFAYDSGPSINSGDHGRGLLYTADENIMIFGTDDGDSFGSNDGLVIKVDADGNLLWKKVYGGVSNDHFQHAVELSHGNILICGSSQSYGPGNIAGYLTKIDSDGNLIWAHSYGGSLFEGFNACDLTFDNNIVAAGITTTFGGGQADMLLCKIDTAGTLQWSKTYGGPFNERASSVKSLPDGSGYLLLGYTDSYGNGSRDILVIRTNIHGDVVWSKTFGTQGFEGVNDWAYSSLLITQEDNLVLTGWSDSLSIAGEDVVLIKSDLEGNAFCSDVNIEVTTPNLEMVVTGTEIASPGTYGAVSSIVINSSMMNQGLCYCVAECNPCEQSVVHFDLNACYSNLDDGSNMDYSEFIPSYPTEISFASISASIVHRENGAMNKHSCTPGVENSPAMCVSSLNSCTYDADNSLSVVFELTVVPSPDSSVQVSSVSFYEKAPTMYNWINGASGLNNYPTRYGIRVLKNGNEIFRQDDIVTSIDVWSNAIFDFSNDDAFIAETSTIFRFELLAYCVIGKVAQVNAWDLDEISISVSCDPITGTSNNISGFIRNAEGTPLGNVDVLLSHDPAFQSYIGNTVTDLDGQYTFKDIRADHNLYVKGYNNSDFLNGVTTLDLIYIQKYLLGLEPFTSPYQLIAADANRSNSVSALDIHRLRSLILGRITELPDNTSWRFADANQVLSIENPWDCMELFEAPPIGIDIGNAHFIGIKTGDVTFDATSIIENPVKGRPTKDISFLIKEQDVFAGVPLSVQVHGRNFVQINGFQCALKFLDCALVEVVSKALTIADDFQQYHSDRQKLYLSWNEGLSESYTEDDVLFELRIVPLKNGKLSEMVKLDPHDIAAQGYQGSNLVIRNLKLAFEGRIEDIHRPLGLLNTPNPFGSSTTLHFDIEQSGEVEIVIYNVDGHILSTYKRILPAGNHELTITSKEIGIEHGVIFCKIKSANQTETCKMIIAKSE